MDKKIIRIVEERKPDQSLIQLGDVRIFVYCEETNGALELTHSIFEKELKKSKTFDEVKSLVESKNFTISRCPACNENHIYTPPYDIRWDRNAGSSLR